MEKTQGYRLAVFTILGHVSESNEIGPASANWKGEHRSDHPTPSPGHGSVGVLSHCVDVRVKLPQLVVAVRTSELLAIYGQGGVGVDGHQHDPAVCVDTLVALKPDFQVVQD